MAPRKRKQEKDSNGEGDGKPVPEKPSSKVSQPKPEKPAPASSNGSGMTCMNWFIVLFFIFGVAGGASFFIYNEMTMMNKALMKELESLKSGSGDFSAMNDKIKSMEKSVELIQQLKEDMATIKENEVKRKVDVAQFKSLTEKSQQMVQDVAKQFEKSQRSIEEMKKEMKDLKSASNSGTSKETEESLKTLTDRIAVAATDVESLSKEVVRLEKNMKEYSKQSSSIQQEVIDLTADKVAMASSIESIKTTVVTLRDRLDQGQNKESGAQDAGVVEKKIQDLDTKLSAEISRLARQISETAENSAAWLQQSTNDMNEKVQQAVEDLTKRFNEAKAIIQEPTEATPDQAIINSVAALSRKLDETVQSIDVVDKFVQAVENKRRENEDNVAIELEGTKESLTKLTERVIEVKGRDESLENSMVELAKKLTAMSNDLNGLKTTARHLETRMEEISKNKPAEKPQPAAAPDPPEEQRKA